MNWYDIAVVGAGPAGCAAALDLARGGASVALIEKANLPRYKTCGGGLLNRAYRILPTGVDHVVERSFGSIALNFLDRDLHFVTTRTSPIVYMTMRAHLDQLLAREAACAGAAFMEGCAVKGVRACDDCAELETSHGLLRAKFVVAADGVNSLLARSAGWSESRRLVPALECEVKTGADDFRRCSEIARFDFGVTRTGYAWVFPKRDHLSVGILTMRRGRINLHKELMRYLELLTIRDVKSVEMHGHLIPVSPRKGPLAKGRVFLVGDAAGLVDPITGEGISYAVSSGRLAARAILEHYTNAADASNCYHALLDRDILSELRAARILALFLYRFPALRHLSFRVSGQKLCEFVTDVVMGDNTYREAARKPSNYLKAIGLWRR